MLPVMEPLGGAVVVVEPADAVVSREDDDDAVFNRDRSVDSIWDTPPLLCAPTLAIDIVVSFLNAVRDTRNGGEIRSMCRAM